MSTLNALLTEKRETLIEALVQSGRYQNAREVMREGLRLVESREAEVATKVTPRNNRITSNVMTGIVQPIHVAKLSADHAWSLSFFCKHFQICPFFLQTFPNIYLVVLWDFKDLQ
jgi:putative addiction module CopG family antidote